MSADRLLAAVETWIPTFFAEKIDKKYAFHDLEHTTQVVAAADMLAEGFMLGEPERRILLTSAWFHDAGYSEGADGHEERSANLAAQFLTENGMDAAEIQQVVACIQATRVPQKPNSHLEKMLCDADLSHLGMKIFWDRTSRLRLEYATTRGININDSEWVERELKFLMKHEFHTSVAREQFKKRKDKNVEQLLRQRGRLNPELPGGTVETGSETSNDKSDPLAKMLKQNEAQLKQERLGRGVETMYRTTYRTHTNLSAMADSKANLMLSVNAIVLSILIANLLPRLKSEPQLVIPSILLMLTCLVSMIFATLATRPKVTEGKISREDIMAKKGNLLFFGNFYNMPLDDFQWGVNELIRDSDYLYNSMSRDLYFLGKVLAKKYSYLSLCYNLFMWGLIISVLAFGWTFLK